MWLTPGRASDRKNSALILLKKERYEEEVQPYRKSDYKPLIYVLFNSAINNAIFDKRTSFTIQFSPQPISMIIFFTKLSWFENKYRKCKVHPSQKHQVTLDA